MSATNTLTATTTRPITLRNRHRDIECPAGIEVTLREYSLNAGTGWVTIRHAERNSYTTQIHLDDLNINA